MQLPHPGRLQAALFDLDGTLVDTVADISAALNAALSESGVALLSEEQVRQLVGRGSDQLVRSALAAQGAQAALFATVSEAYRRHYGDFNGRQARVYPGVVDCVGRLRARGVKLGCVTNKPQAFAQSLLQTVGLAPSFECVYGGDAFERRKPDPLPLLMACRALQAEPSRTLMVGDSVNDALAARAAGCPVVLVSYGYNHGRPVREVDADGYLDSMAELVA